MAEQIGKFATAQVVHHGPGALSRLQGEIRRLGGERPVIVTDPGVVKAGIRDQVLQALEQSAPVWDSVEGEPRYTLVEECASFLRANQCDWSLVWAVASLST
jgi:alcohol dehydrogenase class IV